MLLYMYGELGTLTYMKADAASKDVGTAAIPCRKNVQHCHLITPSLLARATSHTSREP